MDWKSLNGQYRICLANQIWTSFRKCRVQNLVTASFKEYFREDSAMHFLQRPKDKKKSKQPNQKKNYNNDQNNV